MREHTWHIQLFGSLKVHQDARTITRFLTRKAGVLLAYLAYYQKRSHPREHLVELLWPESDPAAARTNLRVALTSLRRQLEPPGVPGGSILMTDRTNLHLNPCAVTTDVAEFEAALKSAAAAHTRSEQAQCLAHAIEIYRGELLPAYYEDWVLTERDRLSDVYVGALRQLTTALEQDGDLTRLIDYARRMVAVDSLREEAHFELMRLYAAAGRSSAALRQYQAIEQILAEEFGEQPSAKVQALAKQLQGDAPSAAQTRIKRRMIVSSASHPHLSPSPPPSAAPTPSSSLPQQFTRFFGRQEEMARLGELFQDSNTRLVTLTGAAGTGKTRLAIEFARSLTERWDGAVWFAPLADLTDARLLTDAILASLRLPRATDREPLEQVMEALTRQPSLLILDNFEQLVEEGALTVRTLLEQVPALTCLVTSRQPLDLIGEQEFPVPSCRLPPGRARRNDYWSLRACSCSWIGVS